jgi:hypothetical protein
MHTRAKRREQDARGAGESPVAPHAAPVAAGGAASAASGGGSGAVAAMLVVMLGFAASSAGSLLRNRSHSWRAPDVARALERPG